MLLKLLSDAWRNISGSGRTGDALSALDTLRMLRSAGGTLGKQAGLYLELARLEWEQEKQRLMRMALLTVVALACFSGALLFAGVLLMAVVWDTPYRIPVIAALVGVYLLGVVIAVWRLKLLARKSTEAFASLRAELAADMALIRSQL